MKPFGPLLLAMAPCDGTYRYEVSLEDQDATINCMATSISLEISTK